MMCAAARSRTAKSARARRGHPGAEGMAVVRAQAERPRRPPIDLPDITFRFFWSSRLSADPGNTWLRKTVIGAYEALCQEVELEPGD